MSEQEQNPPTSTPAPVIPTLPPLPQKSDALTALEELVSSPGWALFCEQALAYASADSALQDISGAASKTTDMATLGAMTASRLAASTAIRMVLNLPGEMIRQMTPRKPVKR